MLTNTSLIKGCTIAASDGHIGSVSDFLFDDSTWAIRWLVVDTGNWLPGRKVLLPPSVLGHLDHTGQAFSVKLTMQQIKESPSIDTDQPVSRQMERDVYDYYGWSPYWGNGFYMGGYGYKGNAMTAPPLLGHWESVQHFANVQRSEGDVHLRSTQAVTGYHIHATDGDIGHVADFLFEEADWSIHFLVADTSNWWMGKKVLISPRSATGIDWKNRLVSLGVDRQKVKDGPSYDPSTMMDRMYERNYNSYYNDVWSADPR